MSKFGFLLVGKYLTVLSRPSWGRVRAVLGSNPGIKMALNGVHGDSNIKPGQ